MDAKLPSDSGGHTALSLLLREFEDEIVFDWMNSVADAVASHSIDRDELEDSIRLFVRHLAERLLEGSQERAAAAEEHGKQRHRIGFQLAGMAREYGLLIRSVEHVAYQQRVNVTIGAFGALTRHVVAGIAEATTAFVDEQQKARSNQANQHFAFIAHELRNPLQNMNLALDAWSNGLNEERVRLVMQNSLGAIGELIDASLIDAQERAVLGTEAPTPQCANFDLVELARSVLEMSAPHGDLHATPLLIEAPAMLEVNLDPRLVRSVLTNLVRNAIKFSRKNGGPVTVRLSEPSEGRLHIEVEDQCGGLPPGAAERMFAAFAQLSADRSGFGLGLAIVRQAVEVQGGNIQVHDVAGHGCVFVVDLPIRYG